MCWCCPTATPPRRRPRRSGERFGIDEEPQLVRDALAGEDDAEDAQWLVVLRDDSERLDPAELDAFAGEWDGWREEP